MRYATKLAASAAAITLIIVAAGPSAFADREQRARAESHSSEDARSRAGHRRADARRAYAERQWRRAYERKRARQYAYPWGPWGPFAGPPGL